MDTPYRILWDLRRYMITKKPWSQGISITYSRRSETDDEATNVAVTPRHRCVHPAFRDTEMERQPGTGHRHPPYGLERFSSLEVDRRAHVLTRAFCGRDHHRPSATRPLRPGGPRGCRFDGILRQSGRDVPAHALAA